MYVCMRVCVRACMCVYVCNVYSVRVYERECAHKHANICVCIFKLVCFLAYAYEQ